jgi:hypothetical protein
MVLLLPMARAQHEGAPRGGLQRRANAVISVEHRRSFDADTRFILQEVNT